MAKLSTELNNAVDAFAQEMKNKLLKAQVKYGFDDNWKSRAWEAECQKQLKLHVEKGDPIDVANYCMFMDFHNWSTTQITREKDCPILTSEY